MISLHACPRCKGAVFEYSPAEDENALCINCGWRRAEVPQAILAQVEAHLGSPFVEHTPVRIGTGKAIAKRLGTNQTEPRAEESSGPLERRLPSRCRRACSTQAFLELGKRGHYVNERAHSPSHDRPPC